MGARTVLVVLVGIGFVAIAAAPSAQQREVVARASDTPAAVVPAARTTPTVEGTWEFNPDDSHEDQRNWRRAVHPDDDTEAQAPPARLAILPPEAYDNDVRRALRDLLEIAQTYTMAVHDKDVTITDDIGRSTTYATDGRREKHQLGATEFDARTTWDHALLTQQIEALDLIKMSQVFMPSEDGRSMFIWIKVAKPDMTPPIKPITRVYSRAAAPASGAATPPRTSSDPARRLR